MPTYSLKIKGVKQVKRDFQRFGKAGEDELSEVTRINALEIKRNAISNVKQKTGKTDYVVTGHLSRSFYETPTDEKGHHYTVGNLATYAPYVEFGTGKSVVIPKGMEKIAEQFRGRGIRQINLPARAFLYPALISTGKQYIKDLNNALNHLAQQFNK